MMLPMLWRSLLLVGCIYDSYRLLAAIHQAAYRHITHDIDGGARSINEAEDLRSPTFSIKVS
jgi:hypothetical protein